MAVLWHEAYVLQRGGGEGLFRIWVIWGEICFQVIGAVNHIPIWLWWHPVLQPLGGEQPGLRPRWRYALGWWQAWVMAQTWSSTSFNWPSI